MPRPKMYSVWGEPLPQYESTTGTPMPLDPALKQGMTQLFRRAASSTFGSQYDDLEAWNFTEENIRGLQCKYVWFGNELMKFKWPIWKGMWRHTIKVDHTGCEFAEYYQKNFVNLSVAYTWVNILDGKNTFEILGIE